jgi:hypothetical protein
MHIHFHRHLRYCHNYWLFEYPLFWHYLHNNIVLYRYTYSVLHHNYLKPTRYSPCIYLNANALFDVTSKFHRRFYWRSSPIHDLVSLARLFTMIFRSLMTVLRIANSKIHQPSFRGAINTAVIKTSYNHRREAKNLTINFRNTLNTLQDSFKTVPSPDLEETQRQFGLLKFYATLTCFKRKKNQ